MLKKALTNELQESYYMAKICYVCRKKFEDKYANDKKYCKGRDHNYQTGEHRGATHSICNLKDSIPKEIIIHFHNELNYGYYFVKKKLAKGFEWTCLGKHTERHLTVSIPVEKEVKQLVKNGAQITKGISYKLEFVDSTRFMASSYSFKKGTHEIKCKNRYCNKKSQTCRIKYKCCLEYTGAKDDLIA